MGLMKQLSVVSASQAKQAFGELLARAERHGKVVAAREAQRDVELGRLLAHQAIAIDLLVARARRRDALRAAARKEVDRWERDGLCSKDYIELWRKWLRKPVATLARLMTSDPDGWGNAMRQNSPFALLGTKARSSVRTACSRC
jgi:hypothetical protein